MLGNEKAQVLSPINLGQVCPAKSFGAWPTEFLLLLPVMTLKFQLIRQEMLIPVQTRGSEKAPWKFSRPKEGYHSSSTW